MEKHCENCRHHGCGIVEEPCCRCDVTDFTSNRPVEFTQWESEVKEILHRGKPIPTMEPVEEPRLSYLGQTALNSLCEISNNLRCIEEFIDGPCSPILELGCPDNLLHNLKLIAEVSNNINERMNKIREKL